MAKTDICNKYINVAITSLTLLPCMLLAIMVIPIVQSLYHLTPFFADEGQINAL